MTRMNIVMSLAMIPPMLIADGCSGGKLADLAEEMARRQAAQQEKLIEETRKLSEASRDLVNADATARKELTEFQSEIQQGIQSERQSVDRQREELEDERREIAVHRHRDPLIAAGMVQAATLIVAVLPILVLIYLFRAARDEPPEAAVGELLVQEMTSQRPLLLPGPVFHPPALKAPDDPSPPDPSSDADPAAARSTA